MWRTSASAPAAVRRKLPATVAPSGRFSVYWFRYACAADHGALIEVGETAALVCGASSLAGSSRPDAATDGAPASAGYSFCGGEPAPPTTRCGEKERCRGTEG